ncbi:MAG: peptide chain release factor 2 [Ruminococcaceae bacterium]|nr:peptide chain release factor 2 [Oscillospiraceae bacterium]
MLQYEELRLRLEGLFPQIEDLAQSIGLSQLIREADELDARAAAPGFWDDMESAKKITQKTATIKDKIDAYQRLQADYQDTLTLIELANEAEDLSLYDECVQSIEQIEKSMETQRLATLLSGEYDSKNAILTFHAGTGGTEAQDWAEMLYRMYTHWAERHGYKYNILDYQDGDEAGLKSASIEILGENAYGYLKGEAGVHRLVRISPFDASGRRHTSFSALEVMPEIDEDTQVDIRPEDIKMDVFRSSGAGGQHINKTSSAVRLTHIPTGIVVACQNERSQFQNRDKAMAMLKSKLVEIKEREHLEKLDDIKGNQAQIAWGSQIRSYVFMPYTLAKDTRTGFETGNIQAVMDGEIDGFINAYLQALANGTLGKATAAED